MLFFRQELAKEETKSAFQLKAGFETEQRQKELENAFFRRTAEMREEPDLDDVRVCVPTSFEYSIVNLLAICMTGCHST